MSEEVLRLEVVDASPTQQPNNQLVPSDSDPKASFTSKPTSDVPAIHNDPAVVAPPRPAFDPVASSLPEKSAQPWGPDEDPVIDAIKEIVGQFADFDDAVNNFHDSVEELEAIMDDIPLPFEEGMDEQDFNDFGIGLSGEMKKGDNFKLPPLMPPTWDEKNKMLTHDQYGRDNITPPPPPPTGIAIGEAVTPSDEGTWARKPQTLGEQSDRLSSTVGHVAGSAVGSAVGQATGSNLAGTLAGTGVSMLAEAAAKAHPAVAAMGAVALIAAAAIAKVSDMANKAAESLKEIDGNVATAFAERDMAMLQQDMNRSERMGGALANDVRADTKFDLAMQQFSDGITETFLPVLTTVTDMFATALEYLNLIVFNTKPVTNFDNFEGMEEIVRFVNPVNQQLPPRANGRAGGAPIAPPAPGGNGGGGRRNQGGNPPRLNPPQRRKQWEDGKKQRRAAAGLPPLENF